MEEGPFGRICLNRGCIPSKMLVHVADVGQTIRDAGRFGTGVARQVTGDGGYDGHEHAAGTQPEDA